MKKLKIILLLTAITAATATAQEWEFVGLDSLVILHLRINGDTIYAGTLSRNINFNSGLYYSSDQGDNFVQIDSSLGNGTIVGFEYSVNNTIYIIKCPCQAPFGSTLRKTTDNGQNWSIVNNISNNPIQWFGISPFNQNKMYAIDVLGLGAGRYFNNLYKSTNRGNSWEVIGSFPGSSHGSEITFAFDLTDSTNLYVIVDDKWTSLYLFKSTDEGSSWSYISSPPFFPREIYGDYSIPDRLYLTPYPYLSNNGGLSWAKADSGLTDTSSYLSFYQNKVFNNILYELKSDGLYFTPNDSIFWSKVDGSEDLPLIMGTNGFPNYNENLKNVFVDNLTNKIYVGTARGIFRSDLVTNLSNEVNPLPNDILLGQNYPNPFNPSTTIKYQVPESGTVTLKVYDILGSEVATLVNEEKAQGRYEVTFNAGNLASGVYIYRLNVNEFTDVKKMLLLK